MKQTIFRVITMLIAFVTMTIGDDISGDKVSYSIRIGLSTIIAFLAHPVKDKKL